MALVTSHLDVLSGLAHLIRAMYRLLWYDAVQEAARAVGKRLLACEPTLSTISNRLHDVLM